MTVGRATAPESQEKLCQGQTYSEWKPPQQPGAQGRLRSESANNLFLSFCKPTPAFLSFGDPTEDEGDGSTSPTTQIQNGVMNAINE